ncbi:unnamed protein product [Durusdinium trenchii]|uniref:Uncharacterized protein n=1 Tax=Durusdinium trenchii TaxID=1381693 RepID=A0ABP0IZJ0_9DINO
MCGLPMDRLGRHALSCMAGGDAILVHNTVRHVVQDYCERAGMRPTAEAPGVLQDLAIPEGRRRPADLLVCHGAGLADRLPDGSQPHHLPQTALGIAVINATGPSHWPKTFESPGAASSAYATCNVLTNRRQPSVLRQECDSELVFADMVRKIAIVLCRAAARSLQRRRRTWFRSPGTPASAAAVAAGVTEKTELIILLEQLQPPSEGVPPFEL